MLRCIILFALAAAAHAERVKHHRVRSSAPATAAETTASTSPIPKICETNANPMADCPAFDIPEKVYGAGAECPFARWFSAANSADGAKRMGNWEENMLQTYGEAFEKAGPPTPSWTLNDHNYNTKLGQGNTIGFLKAHLDIDPAHLTGAGLPAVGIFAKKQKGISALVRLSDFGRDKADPNQRLGRLAMKLPWAKSDAWAGEVNFLFTEALSVFPLADYRALQTFAGDDNTVGSKIFGNLRLAWHAGKSIFWTMGRSTMRASQAKEFPGKRFYSQLPYALGDGHSMKLELVPGLPACDGADTESAGGTAGICACVPKVSEKVSGPEWAPARAAALSAFATQCGFSWKLRIRVLPNSDERTQKQANVAWTDVDPIVVGTLRVERQATSGATGVGLALYEKLKEHFPAVNTPLQMSKLFRFHPIMTHEAHKPRGEVNHFRSTFYAHHAEARHLTIQKGLKPSRGKVPFAEMMQFFATSSASATLDEKHEVDTGAGRPLLVSNSGQ